MAKKKNASPLVEVVDIPPGALESAAGSLHFTHMSASGKHVYYVFVPWTAVMVKLREEGIAYFPARPEAV